MVKKASSFFILMKAKLYKIISTEHTFFIIPYVKHYASSLLKYFNFYEYIISSKHPTRNKFALYKFSLIPENWTHLIKFIHIFWTFVGRIFIAFVVVWWLINFIIKM